MVEAKFLVQPPLPVLSALLDSSKICDPRRVSHPGGRAAGGEPGTPKYIAQSSGARSATTGHFFTLSKTAWWPSGRTPGVRWNPIAKPYQYPRSTLNWRPGQETSADHQGERRWSSMKNSNSNPKIPWECCPERDQDRYLIPPFQVNPKPVCALTNKSGQRTFINLSQTCQQRLPSRSSLFLSATLQEDTNPTRPRP